MGAVPGALQVQNGPLLTPCNVLVRATLISSIPTGPPEELEAMKKRLRSMELAVSLLQKAPSGPAAAAASLAAVQQRSISIQNVHPAATPAVPHRPLLWVRETHIPPPPPLSLSLSLSLSPHLGEGGEGGEACAAACFRPVLCCSSHTLAPQV